MAYNMKEDFKKLEKTGIESSDLEINVSYSQNGMHFF